MTITKFRADAEDSNVGAIDLTLSRPSGTADGDWLIMIIGCTPSSGQTVALPGSFTELYGHPSGYLRVGYKLASSEPSSYSINVAGGSGARAAAGSVTAYSGGDAAKPPVVGSAVVAATSSAIAGTPLPIPAGGAILVHLGFAHHSSTSGTITGTAPYGMKERTDIDEQTSTVTCHVYVADQYVNFGPGAVRSEALAGTAVPATETIGMQLVVFQAPLARDAAPTKRRAILIEMDAWDEAAASVVTRKYSDYGITFTDNVRYAPRIVGSVIVNQQAADSVGVGGRIATTISAIDLDNADGSLTDIHAKMLASGRKIIVKTVEITSQEKSDVGAGASSSAETFFTGIVSDTQIVGTNVRLNVGDKADLLNVPLQSAVFSGGAGLGGGSELEGVTKPLTTGRVYNIFPVDLGSVDMGSGSFPTYMMNSDTISNTISVRIRGVLQTEVGGAPAAGQYLPFDSEANGAVFQLGATPDGVVTCDLAGDNTGGYANQTGEVLTRLLTGFGGTLVSADLESSTFTDVDVFLPGEIGWHSPAGSKITIYQACDEVLRHAAVWLSGGRNGKLRAAIASPGPSDKIRLREADVVALATAPLPSQLQPTPRHVDVRATPNWYPIDDIASSVTGTARQKLSSPGQMKRSTSTTVQTRQVPERTWTLPGLFFLAADAQTRADQLRLWVEPGLRAVSVTTDRYRNRVEIGMSCELEGYPRFDLESGFGGIVAAWREEPATGRVTMLLIGTSGTGAELREDGSLELREDGSFELRE